MNAAQTVQLNNFLLKNKDELSGQTQSDIAEICKDSLGFKVSPSKISEFCRSMGYDWLKKQKNTGIMTLIKELEGRVAYLEHVNEVEESMQ